MTATSATSHRRVSPSSHRPRALSRPWLLAAALAVTSACGDPDADPPLVAEAPPQPVDTSPALRAPDPDLLARYPSLAYYPRVPPELVLGLRDRDALAIFRGLELAFQLERWPGIDAWQRLAHIRLAAPAGFVRTEDGQPVPLSSGTYDLGCLGGFLEAVRLLYLPRLELADLVPCDPPQGFESCEGGAHAGRAALLQIAARLPAEALPRGIVFVEHRLDDLSPTDLVAAFEADVLHLCTVSHRARARDGERMYHHMMIIDPTRDPAGRVHIFDTTGAAGVALRTMRSRRLHTYTRRLLALSPAFRYDPASALLTCLAVVRPAALPADARLKGPPGHAP